MNLQKKVFPKHFGRKENIPFLIQIFNFSKLCQKFGLKNKPKLPDLTKFSILMSNCLVFGFSKEFRTRLSAYQF